MKYVKILSLLAVAVAAMMAFAASASAAYVSTSTGGPPATPTVHAVNENGHLTLQNPTFNISCSSTVEGTVESHGSGVPVSGNISTLTFTSCTNSWHVTTVTGGSLSVKWTSGHNGILYSSGARVDITRFGQTCVYETDNTEIGTVTGGNPATLHIGATIPINTSESSAFPCGTSAAKWEGNYVTTSALFIGGVAGTPTTVTTTTGGEPETPTIHAINDGGHVTLQNPIANISCSSTVEGVVEGHGGEVASGNIGTLTFTGCTNSWHVTTVEPGSLSVKWTSGHNGTLYSSGAKVDTTRFGVTCVYETDNTKIGTVTGGNPATLHIEATIPINDPDSGALCGTSAAKWEGSYVTTSALYIRS